MGLPKIVILGAGYGGLMTAKGLQKELHYNEAEVTLVNENAYHYFTTQLHEAAAGTVNHDRARVTISTVIDTKKIDFIQDRVVKVQLAEKKIYLENRMEPLCYDYLVIGLGSSPETFGIKGLLQHALFIRNINSIRVIREHMEYMFSRYQEEKKEELITIVVGGAGFTGIEYLGELVERMPFLCRNYDVSLKKIRLINVEAAPTVLPGFDKDLVDYVVKYFEARGVRFLIDTPIEECFQDRVILKGGEEIKAATIVWTGGVRGNKVVEESGLKCMRGRIKVDSFLRVPDQQEVFIVGDSSLVLDPDDRPYPPTAQIATQQGQLLGKNLVSLIRGGEMRPFKYKTKGTVVSLGSKEAVGVVGNKKIYGGIASWMKKIIDLRWLFLLGGIPLVIRKGKF